METADGNSFSERASKTVTAGSVSEEKTTSGFLDVNFLSLTINTYPEA